MHEAASRGRGLAVAHVDGLGMEVMAVRRGQEEHRARNATDLWTAGISRKGQVPDTLPLKSRWKGQATP